MMLDYLNRYVGVLELGGIVAAIMYAFETMPFCSNGNSQKEPELASSLMGAVAFFSLLSLLVAFNMGADSKLKNKCLTLFIVSVGFFLISKAITLLRKLKRRIDPVALIVQISIVISDILLLIYGFRNGFDCIKDVLEKDKVSCFNDYYVGTLIIIGVGIPISLLIAISLKKILKKFFPFPFKEDENELTEENKES